MKTSHLMSASKTELHRVRDILLVRRAIERNKGKLSLAMGYIRLMQKFVERSAEDMELLAVEFCEDCRSSCCKADNHLHFSDMLRFCLVAGAENIPQFHTVVKGPMDVPCIYLTKNGCELGRKYRPFICAHHFCDKVKEYVSTRMDDNAKFVALLDTAAKLRCAMEAIVELYEIEIGEGSAERIKEIRKPLKGFLESFRKYRTTRR